MKTAAACLSLVSTTLLACKLGNSTPAGNCNASQDPEMEFCFEYPKDGVESGKKVCAGWTNAKWSDGPCDRTNALGSCETMDGIRKVFYKGTKFSSADEAKLQCSKPWTDGK